MDNYEYIIAGLPVIQQNSRDAAPDADALIAEIREQLSKKDDRIVGVLLDGFDSSKLTPEFYRDALSSNCRFIRNYFEFDLNLRNARVKYLNKELGRPDGQDVMKLGKAEDEEEKEFEQLGRINAVLEGSNILDREKGLDDIMWEKIDSLTYMDVLNLNVILGFIAKLKIIDRWNKLDPETGMALFRKLVEDIRATYDNKKQNLI